MATVFEFEAGKAFHFTTAFAKQFNSKVANDRVFLPESVGEGFIQESFLNNGLSLCLHRYTLKEEFILKRHGAGATEVLTIKFDGRRVPVYPTNIARRTLFTTGKGHEVEFGTSNFFTEVTIPPNEEICFLVIVTTRSALMHLLQPGEGETAIGNTIRDNPSFFLHEGMTWEMEQTLKQISQVDEKTKLPALLYQTRAQELIYLLFIRLFGRTKGVSLPLNEDDVKKMHQVRASILADLSTPPRLPGLARDIGMSATKMKRLFRQVFGVSIYNYFQAERMNEAAQLLKHFTVSQTGYRIGFSNLSHFARVFEKHHRMKPKRYKDTLLGVLQEGLSFL